MYEVRSEGMFLSQRSSKRSARREGHFLSKNCPASHLGDLKGARVIQQHPQPSVRQLKPSFEVGKSNNELEAIETLGQFISLLNRSKEQEKIQTANRKICRYRELNPGSSKGTKSRQTLTFRFLNCTVSGRILTNYPA